MAEIEFVPWPKIARWEGETMTITEKLDGTNACIIFAPLDPEFGELNGYKVGAQSRNRMITVDQDNAGFAGWVDRNSESLFNDLGFGRHYGEWYGQGIQRKYGLDHKRFALFNTHKFADAAPHFETPNLGIVPILYDGPFHTETVDIVHKKLRAHGSVAAPGFDNPEGIVVFLNKSHTAYKLTDAVAGPAKPRFPGE